MEVKVLHDHVVAVLLVSVVAFIENHDIEFVQVQKPVEEGIIEFPHRKYKHVHGLKLVLPILPLVLTRSFIVGLVVASLLFSHPQVGELHDLQGLLGD